MNKKVIVVSILFQLNQNNLMLIINLLIMKIMKLKIYKVLAILNKIAKILIIQNSVIKLLETRQIKIIYKVNIKINKIIESKQLHNPNNFMFLNFIILLLYFLLF